MQRVPVHEPYGDTGVSQADKDLAVIRSRIMDELAARFQHEALRPATKRRPPFVWDSRGYRRLARVALRYIEDELSK